MPVVCGSVAPAVCNNVTRGITDSWGEWLDEVVTGTVLISHPPIPPGTAYGSTVSLRESAQGVLYRSEICGCWSARDEVGSGIVVDHQSVLVSLVGEIDGRRCALSRERDALHALAAREVRWLIARQQPGSTPLREQCPAQFGSLGSALLDACLHGLLAQWRLVDERATRLECAGNDLRESSRCRDVDQACARLQRLSRDTLRGAGPQFACGKLDPLFGELLAALRHRAGGHIREHANRCGNGVRNGALWDREPTCVVLPHGVRAGCPHHAIRGRVPLFVGALEVVFV